jgi:hypothetical protein
MKRIAALLAPLALLVACGADIESEPTEPTVIETQNSGQANDWQIITDPANGRVFHCLYVEAWGYKSGGPAIWCYEPLDTPPTTG